jgi:multidrug efflux system membrane fusion protein
MRASNLKWMIILPLAVIAVAIVVMVIMIKARPEPETRIPEVPLPVVRFAEVQLQDLTLTVQSQGTVSPRTESLLLPEVAGRIIEVSPAFVPGGFFEKGELLLRIDPFNYRQADVQARGAIAQAELRLAMELAEAEVARNEWKELGQGKPTALTLREPQVAEAEAALAAARAALESAGRNLERTTIVAPYAGRVRQKQVDVGQYVSPGTPLATIYAVDYAEIRLPLPDDDLAFVDLPLDYRGETSRGRGPEVTLRADFAGQTFSWKGRIVRTEGEIDPRSRMVHAVARVSNPYSRSAHPERPPLAAGMYVEAEIAGRSVEGVALIPRSAVRADDVVLVVDDEERLRFRPVEILRATSQHAIISSGLADGERICISNLAAVTDGMRVRIAPAEVSE